MVTPRPLKLRAQVVRTTDSQIAPILPVAQVWVDTGVFHLDSPYEYWVPESLSEQAQLGVRVEVPFGSALREGLVLARVAHSANSGSLKRINKVLSPTPIATHDSLKLIEKCARRWSGSPLDIVRSAVPPRTREVAHNSGYETVLPRAESISHEIPLILRAEKVRAFWTLPASGSAVERLANLIWHRLSYGQVLVVLPDERSIRELELMCNKIFGDKVAISIDGGIPRSQRYTNFLRAVSGDARLILSLRGGIFTPLQRNSTVIVVNESSHLLYEPRTPGWNARDVALLRAVENFDNVILTGYSPSLECARLLETGWLTYVAAKRRKKIFASESTKGELLPSAIYSLVRRGLATGPVLFVVPRKGYGNSVLCSKCRNVATCACGGRLQQLGATAEPQCAICSKKFPNWRCDWCQNSLIYLASRGIDRFVEEIGKSFPQRVIVNSSGSHIVDSLPENAHVAVATPGAIPTAPEGYAAVIILQGARFFAHSDLRSAERARELFFESAAHVSPTGEIGLVIDPVHPIVSALTLWDPSTMVKRELEEHARVQLVPFYRFVVIELDSREATSVCDGFIRARSDGRIPETTHILGPHERTSGASRLTLSAPMAMADSLVDFIHEFQRRRSISGKPLLNIRVDPYSLV